VNAEQIKMAATACNNRGVGALLAGTIVPLMAGQSHSLAWYVFGLVFLGVAQAVLGELE
jgi:hypothetical protein